MRHLAHCGAAPIRDANAPAVCERRDVKSNIPLLVCTTELVAFAQIAPELRKRNVELLGFAFLAILA